MRQKTATSTIASITCFYHGCSIGASPSTTEAEPLQEISTRPSRAGEEVDGAAENSTSPHGGVDHSRAESKSRKLEEIFLNKCVISKLLRLSHFAGVFHLVLQQRDRTGQKASDQPDSKSQEEMLDFYTSIKTLPSLYC